MVTIYEEENIVCAHGIFSMGMKVSIRANPSMNIIILLFGWIFLVVFIRTWLKS